jgi:hypothetical protein
MLSAEATARVNQTLEELRGAFDITQTDIMIAGREIHIFHPRNADDLISEKDYVEDERLPYWADLWPSARVLAQRVATMPVDGRRFLELGCGAGLVSVAAAMAGFDVTATDYYEEALRFTAVNVLLNTGVLIDTRIGDWRPFRTTSGGSFPRRGSDRVVRAGPRRPDCRRARPHDDRAQLRDHCGPRRLAAPQFLSEASAACRQRSWNACRSRMATSGRPSICTRYAGVRIAPSPDTDWDPDHIGGEADRARSPLPVSVVRRQRKRAVASISPGG